MKTKLKKRMTKIYLFALIASFISLLHAQQTEAKPNELLNALIEVNGGYKHIASKKDVQFTYIYDNQAKGKDVSTERHIFNDEHSWAYYFNVSKANKAGLVNRSLEEVAQNQPNGYRSRYPYDLKFGGVYKGHKAGNISMETEKELIAQ